MYPRAGINSQMRTLAPPRFQTASGLHFLKVTPLRLSLGAYSPNLLLRNSRGYTSQTPGSVEPVRSRVRTSESRTRLNKVNLRQCLRACDGFRPVTRPANLIAGQLRWCSRLASLLRLMSSTTLSSNGIPPLWDKLPL